MIKRFFCRHKWLQLWFAELDNGPEKRTREDVFVVCSRCEKINRIIGGFGKLIEK